MHFTTEMLNKSFVCKKGNNTFILKVNKWPLIKGDFYYNIYIKSSGITEDFIIRAGGIKVLKGDYYNKGNISTWNKGFYCDYEFI